MSWLQEPVSLESNLWRVLKLNGRDFILKGHVEGSSYHVMLSDLCTIWEETLASDDILQRSKVRSVLIFMFHYYCTQCRN